MGLLDAVGGLIFGDKREDVDKGAFDLPGEEERRRRLLERAARVEGRDAPQSAGTQISPFERAAGLDTAQQQQIRQRQLSNLGALEAAAAGRGPSVAEEQFKRATAANVRALQAAAAGAPRGQQALARQAAVFNASQQQAGIAGGAAQARAAEAMAARQQLTNALAGTRGQDIGLAAQQAAINQFNAGQQNQRSLEQARLGQQNQQFNVEAQLRQMGLNDQQISDLFRQELLNAQLGQGGRISLQQLLSGLQSPGEQLLGGTAALGGLFAGRGGGGGR